MPIGLQDGARFAAPLVDSLKVRVVVDSQYDLFIADASHPAVRIEHTRLIDGRENSILAGEWGLSLHLESRRGGVTSRYLLDFGYTPQILIRNFDLLALDPSRLDGLILSHGHMDHYGGLLGFLDQYRGRMRQDLKLFAGGDASFDEKWRKRKGGELVSWGRLDRAAVAAQKVETQNCESARALGGAFTTGRIGRGSFERVLENSFVESAGHFTEAELQGRLVPDQHPDEHATAYVVQGKGLVVISSCGHAGLINTIQTAIKVSGVAKLHAVLGGFHLGPAPQDYVEQTVRELKALAPDVVIPMHCSGGKFVEAMKREMSERLVVTNTGSLFTFGV